MAQVTIYKDATVTIDVVDGPPPVDQSAQIATLTAEVATLTEQLAAANAKIDAAKAALA